MFLEKRLNCHVYRNMRRQITLSGSLKILLFCSFLALIFAASFVPGTVSAQEAGKLSGYVTIDQNQMTYRTHTACLATQEEHGTSYTRCIVDPKLGGTTGFGYNCGARAFTEIFGYWATHGYPALMAGSPTGEVPEYSDQILALWNLAGVEYTTYGDYSSYYSCHNCDIGMTAYKDHYRTEQTSLVTKVAAYFTLNGYYASVIAKGVASYADIKAEIDAGRPVALGMNNCNHWLTAVGYNDAGPNLIALVGHENFTSEAGCTYLDTGAGDYEAEFPYNYFAVSGNNAVFVIPSLTPPPEPPPPPPAPVTYSVGGSIAGLTKNGLTVSIATNGTPQSIASGSTAYRWTGIDSGTYYDVHVVTNPIGLNCTISNHEGFLGSNVTNVNIVCKKLVKKR